MRCVAERMAATRVTRRWGWAGCVEWAVECDTGLRGASAGDGGQIGWHHEWCGVVVVVLVAVGGGGRAPTGVVDMESSLDCGFPRAPDIVSSHTHTHALSITWRWRA